MVGKQPKKKFLKQILLGMQSPNSADTIEGLQVV